MNTKLYYFSGTGNSLSVSKKIHSKLEDSTLISIPQIIEKNEIDGDVIGIVCPIYMHNLPYIVVDFIKKIKAANYIFIVVAGGGEFGNGIRATKKLFGKQGLQLSALFNIQMPSNYTPYGCPDEMEINKILSSVDAKIETILQTVKKKARFFDSNNTSFFKSFVFPGILYKLGYSRINMMDNSFHVENSCDGCGICGQLCPVDNIKMKDNTPTWNNHCQQCFGCLQWCPKQAIQYGKRTANIKRYHHPQIKVKDIITAAPKH